MDESPESASEPGDHDGGGEAPRPTMSRDGGGGRRWWEQPWLWLGVVVVVVAAAFGVSVAVSSDPDDITPTADTTNFCAAVAKYKTARDADPGSVSSTADLDASPLRPALGEVQQAAPEEIRATVDEVATTLDQIIQVQRDHQTVSTGLDAIAAADAKLAEIERDSQHATTRFANYVRRACGVDLNAPPPPTTGPVATTAPVGARPPPTTS
jgi:hypothetical protein